MSLSLKEKQFLRSIIELIIQNPEVAKDVLHFAKEQEKYSATLNKISPLIQFSGSNSNCIITSPDYYTRFVQEINKIQDREVQAVAKSAINSSNIQHNHHVHP